MAEGNNKMFIIAGIVILGIVAFFAFGGGLGGADDAGDAGDAGDADTEETETPAVVGVDIVDDVTITVKDKNGALADTDNINLFITKNDEYAGIYEAFEAKSNDKIADPYTEGDYSSAITLDANGQATLTLVSPAGAVTYYDILVFDTDTGATDDYVDTIATIGVLGKETADGTQSLTVVSDEKTTISAFKEIKVTLRSDVSIINDEAEVTSYVRVLGANASESAKTKTFVVGTTDEYSTATDITVYVEELADVSGTAEVYINDVLINGASVGFSEVTTSNFESKSAVWKNKPVATGTLYALDGVQTVGMGAADATADKVVFEVTVDYDVDVSAVGTTDNAQIKLHFVSFNGHVDSEQETESFTLDLDEDSTATAGFA